MREAGLLMPVSALPSGYGVGDFGKSSFEFIDYLKGCGLRIWQILPLNPLGYGNSPYQPYSSFAGDEIYIDVEKLYAMGLLGERPVQEDADAPAVDYEKVRARKQSYLHAAFKNFTPDAAYEAFAGLEWVYPYGVFMTLKKHNGMKCWNEWRSEHKSWIKDRLFDVSAYEEEIRYEMFVQYMFYCQWREVKSYANAQGIEIMGDIPFYVGIDSLDVWMNQEDFLIGADGEPVFIAGVPPDYFSAEGQRWGNPIYDWEHMEKTGFAFWKKRFGYNAALFDRVRIDHFRAFDTYWKIKATCKNAVNGEWVEAPGYKLFDALLKEFPDAKIVAEDLGDMRKEVYELRDHYGFPGMKIIQFTFDPLEDNNSFADRKNMIVYTGTHDNETMRGWLLNQPKEVYEAAEKELYELGYEEDTLTRNFLCYTLDNIADTAILPVQDVLELGDEGRFNTPGTLGAPNWEWRLTDMAPILAKQEYIREKLRQSGRTEGGCAPVRKKRRIAKAGDAACGSAPAQNRENITKRGE